jgi:hypothetical protein
VEFSSGLANWKDAEAYRGLLAADRSAFAWEWLRRSDDYRIAARAAIGERAVTRATLDDAEEAALAWGLHRFEDPRLEAAAARPMWSAAKMTSVLTARAKPSQKDGDAFLLESVSHFARVVASPDCERILLSDGLRSLRIDVTGTSPRLGPVRLSYGVEGIRSAAAALATLHTFLNFLTARKFPRTPRLFTASARQILLLRTWDAMMAGSDQREIASALLSADAAAERWRINHPSLRSRAQRLVRTARNLAAGGFWRLLG